MKRLCIVVAAMALVTAPRIAFGQSRRAAAESVMENAQAICTFRDSGPSLTVTCPTTLPTGSRLAFATAIANADAVLSGGARRISFRTQGQGEFAKADPQSGISAVSAQPERPPQQPSSASKRVQIGTPADSVLAWRGKATNSRQVGSDTQGLIVEWQYSDVVYLMGRRSQSGIEVYRVIKMTPR